MGELPAVASGEGWVLPMSDGLIQTHGQDARATADIQKLAGSSAGFQPALPSIGRCARDAQPGGRGPSCLRFQIDVFVLMQAQESRTPVSYRRVAKKHPGAEKDWSDWRLIEQEGFRLLIELAPLR